MICTPNMQNIFWFGSWTSEILQAVQTLRKFSVFRIFENVLSSEFPACLNWVMSLCSNSSALTLVEITSNWVLNCQRYDGSSIAPHNIDQTVEGGGKWRLFDLAACKIQKCCVLPYHQMTLRKLVKLEKFCLWKCLLIPASWHKLFRVDQGLFEIYQIIPVHTWVRTE